MISKLLINDLPSASKILDKLIDEIMMVKDYAKRLNYQSRPRLRRSAFLIFCIFIIACTLSLILYYQKFHRIHSQNKTTHPTATTPKPKRHIPTASQPQFDFYILLPKMQVPVSKSENREINTGAKPT